MFILGLTGNIACGKSTVARLLGARGAAHLDADRLVHELYSDPDFARRVAALFPEYSAPLLTPQGQIDRRALGELVFNDAAALARLEAFVHPAVAALRDAKLRQFATRQPPPHTVVLEAVKLIESGQFTRCDAVWCVVCPRQAQLERLVAERGLSPEEARRRLRHQPDPQEQRRRVGSTPFAVIANDGSPELLESKVEQQWKALNFEKNP